MAQSRLPQGDTLQPSLMRIYIRKVAAVSMDLIFGLSGRRLQPSIVQFLICQTLVPHRNINTKRLMHLRRYKSNFNIENTIEGDHGQTLCRVTADISRRSNNMFNYRFRAPCLHNCIHVSEPYCIRDGFVIQTWSRATWLSD